jgi:hypothetical protein
MKKINRDTRIRISLIVGFVAFFFAGLDSLEQGQLILAVSNLLFAIVNLASLYFIKEKESIVNLILLILNAGLASIVSYSYYSSGKMMLPIVWLVVGLFYIVLSFKTFKKTK